jgi:hypothetical protein
MFPTFHGILMPLTLAGEIIVPRDLILERVALRHQLAVLKRRQTRRSAVFGVPVMVVAVCRETLTIIQAHAVPPLCDITAIWKYRPRGRRRGERPESPSRLASRFTRWPERFFLGRTTRSPRTAETRNHRLAGSRLSRHMPVLHGETDMARIRTKIADDGHWPTPDQDNLLPLLQFQFFDHTG